MAVECNSLLLARRLICCWGGCFVSTVLRLARGLAAAAATGATGQGTTPLVVHHEHADIWDLLQRKAARALTSAIALTHRGLSTTIAMQKGRMCEVVPDLEDPPPERTQEPCLNFLTAWVLRSLCRTLTSSRGLIPSYENECRQDCLAGQFREASGFRISRPRGFCPCSQEAGCAHG